MRTPNKERIKLLVDALESGKYRQGQGKLTRHDGEDCCLGVGCKVAIEHGVAVEVEDTGLGYLTYDGARDVMPDAVAEWYGLDADPMLVVRLEAEEGERFDGTATGANDDYGATFEEIAAGFREKYLT